MAIPPFLQYPFLSTRTMKKITTESTLGNYKAIVSVNADEALQEKLLPLGLKYVLQRQTTIDKILGAFVTDADGKAKRKNKWTRNSVDYSADMASKLRSGLSTLAMPDETNLTVDAEIFEYVREVAESKFTSEKAAMSRHESANDLEAWLAEKIGYAGESHGEDGEFHPDALRAIRDYVKAETAKLMA